VNLLNLEEVDAALAALPPPAQLLVIDGLRDGLNRQERLQALMALRAPAVPLPDLSAFFAAHEALDARELEIREKHEAST